MQQVLKSCPKCNKLPNLVTQSLSLLSVSNHLQPQMCSIFPISVIYSLTHSLLLKGVLSKVNFLTLSLVYLSVWLKDYSVSVLMLCLVVVGYIILHIHTAVIPGHEHSVDLSGT